VRKILSPKVVGLDAPKPGKAVFQTTFSSALQVSGKPVSSETPVAPGPRNRSQSAPVNNTAKRAISRLIFRKIIWFTMGSSLA
jgi:hypothetical protein